MRKIVHQSSHFSLTKHNLKNPKKRGKGKRFYKINLISKMPIKDLDEVSTILQPGVFRWGQSWFFNDLQSARRKYTMLMLKWL
jgi:hypothetical protein